MGKPNEVAPKVKGGEVRRRRAGAGRPKAELTKARDDFDAIIQGLIGPNVPEIVQSLIRLAVGVVSEKQTDDGVIVYQMPPDFKSASYLLDRVAGKPRQSVTVDSTAIDISTAVSLTNQAAIDYVDPDESEPVE